MEELYLRAAGLASMDDEPEQERPLQAPMLGASESLSSRETPKYGDTSGKEKLRWEEVK